MVVCAVLRNVHFDTRLSPSQLPYESTTDRIKMVHITIHFMYICYTAERMPTKVI